MDSNGYIFDIQRYAIHDGPGIRTTVFFHGCVLKCWWCHNPECWQPLSKNQCSENVNHRKPFRFMRTKDRVPQLLSSDAVMSGIILDRVFYDQSGGGVTFSGGEPMLQIEFLFELLKECKQNMIHTAVDTCGYAPKEDFIRVYELVDLFLYDLKIMDDDTHKRYTGVSNELILSNLILLNEKGNKVSLRIPLIPEITDTEENINDVLEFIAPLKMIRHISLLPYNPLGEDKSRRLNIPLRMKHCVTQTDDKLQSLKRLFETAGYQVKIGG